MQSTVPRSLKCSRTFGDLTASQVLKETAASKAVTKNKQPIVQRANTSEKSRSGCLCLEMQQIYEEEQM